MTHRLDPNSSSRLVTLLDISQVIFSNILYMNNDEIKELFFTALTPVFWSKYSIPGVKA
jgi:hypothetical protein